jgi:hypothetical protein
MADPVLHYLFEFDRAPAERGRWGRTVDYFVWTDLRPREAPPLTIWELFPEGAVRIPDNDTVMHIVRGGTPHHIEHLFGYWRVCDADVVSIRNVQPDGVCANLLARFDAKTGPKGWDRFWDEERRHIAEFNADPKLRTCGRCGFLHPLAYRFDAQADSPDERAAREAW